MRNNKQDQPRKSAHSKERPTRFWLAPAPFSLGPRAPSLRTVSFLFCDKGNRSSFPLAPSKEKVPARRAAKPGLFRGGARGGERRFKTLPRSELNNRQSPKSRFAGMHCAFHEKGHAQLQLAQWTCSDRVNDSRIALFAPSLRRASHNGRPPPSRPIRPPCARAPASTRGPCSGGSRRRRDRPGRALPAGCR